MSDACFAIWRTRSPVTIFAIIAFGAMVSSGVLAGLVFLPVSVLGTAIAGWGPAAGGTILDACLFGWAASAAVYLVATPIACLPVMCPDSLGYRPRYSYPGQAATYPASAIGCGVAIASAVLGW